jgi:predicted nuclease of restriction endonuclease-like (RecB) superfamily
MIRQTSMARAPKTYSALLTELKQRIRTARLQAALSVNRELVLLYWNIGRDILTRQNAEGWGAKIVDRLATDLRRAFPKMTGLSARSLNYMLAFARAWPEEQILQQVVAKLPWGHNVELLDAVKSPAEREWYARQAIQSGWSRAVMAHQIEGGLYARQGSALTNFSRTLPAEQSELAQQIVKDPYAFDFLACGPDMLERDVERALIDHVRLLIMELGKGFAFVGSQYPLEVGGQGFKPEFAGKMNFYLSAVDDQLRHRDDQPSIGIILCKGRNKIVVEYALRDTAKPMGVARYRLSPALPARLKRELPTLEDLRLEGRRS